MLFSFPSYPQMTLAIFVSFANTIVLLGCTLRMLHIFQLSGYKVRNFFLWLRDRKSKFYIRLFALGGLSFGSMFVVNVVFDRFGSIDYLSYLGMIFYFYLAFVFFLSAQRAPVKVSLRFTGRVKRLTVLMGFVFFGLSYFTLWVGSQIEYVRFALIALIPLLLPGLLLLCNYILWPYEAGVRLWYLRKAQKKLKQDEYKNLIRIGITGSWGKTSCKNILAKMLSAKYSVAASPSSFNTPMGFSKTVNNTLDGQEVLIFEMGARYAGDIKYLCKLFKPRYGILTGIGPQHIDTMKTIEIIKRTKAALVQSLPKDVGVAVINGDNEKCREVFAELDLGGKFLSNITKAKDSAGWVEGIVVTQDGCEFMLHLDGANPVKCETKLLGKHNIENILMCAIMAHKLGVTVEDIAAKIAELSPTPHRLELVKAANGVLILDDSYNASVGGTVAALEVLALFKGQKVVMTPGLVEMGARAEEENFKLGARLAKVADKVIIVNELNKQSIHDGLVSQGFAEGNIYFAKTLQDAKGIYSGFLKPGDVLLIENDLPDNYS
jgi:UDP-N-acetylmuramoyl-tripeptide--D-alanyl-D-alanine ligase